MVTFHSHPCQLNHTNNSESLFRAYIPGDSALSKLRRRLAQCTVISAKNALVTATYKSPLEISEQQIRQLNRSFVIHPYSSLRLHLELFMVFVLFYVVILQPLTSSFRVEAEKLMPGIKWIHKVIRAAQLVDIGCLFFTGIPLQHNGEVVFELKRIAWTYMKTNLVVDLLTAFPELVEFPLAVFASLKQVHRYWFHLTFVVQAYRFTTLLIYLRRLYAWKRMRVSYDTIKYVLIFFLVLFWSIWLILTAFLMIRTRIDQHSHRYFLGAIKRSGRKNCQEIQNYTIAHATEITFGFHLFEYIRAFYTAVSILRMTGYGYASPCQPELIIVLIVLLMIGFLMQVYIFGNFLQALHLRRASTKRYEDILNEVNQLVRFKRTSDTLRSRIVQHIDFKFHGNFYKEPLVNSLITGLLKQQMQAISCLHLVEKVPFFRDLPPDLLTRIVSHLESQIILAGDVIIRHSTIGHSMYFLASGVVAVYAKTGYEITHLGTGAHFGEIAIVIDNQFRTADVIAVETCELYELTQHDFQQALEPYPDVYERIKSSALERLYATERLETQRTSDDDGKRYLQVPPVLTPTHASATRGAKPAKFHAIFDV